MPYQRKTQDVYEIQGNYGYGHGFECVNTETTMFDARRSMRKYRENEKGTTFRIVKKRIKVITNE